MDEFWNRAADRGFGYVALVAITIVVWKFFVNILWPHITKQNEEAQKRLDQATRAFMDELAAQRHLHEKGFEAQVRLMEHHFGQVRDEIRAQPKPRKRP